jgi:ribosomal protein S18 acetylase RimI-like enzyme
MLTDGLIIRRAEPRDASAVAALGARTFADTFGADNTPDDMQAYLAQTYGESQQLAEFTNPDIVTLLVEERGALVAFSQVRRGPAPACVTLLSPVELWRFYVERGWHGRGIAAALMDAALSTGRELGGSSVWLSVWERNPRAIAFYTKCGFSDVGSKVFVVGTDHQTDRVMAREIRHEPSRLISSVNWYG